MLLLTDFGMFCVCAYVVCIVYGVIMMYTRCMCMVGVLYMCVYVFILSKTFATLLPIYFFIPVHLVQWVISTSVIQFYHYVIH